jgi:hypothetical protein
VVLRKQSIHLERVTLPVTFGDASNYRTKTLMFEVVNFLRPYHVILGWLYYVKFTAIPSYIYLKLKIPGPTGIITVEAKMYRALDCEQSNIKLAAAAVAMAELRELSSEMPPTSSVFNTDEAAKVVQIDARNPTKTEQIGANLDPKQESELINFLQCNEDMSAWSPGEMPGVS